MKCYSSGDKRLETRNYFSDRFYEEISMDALIGLTSAQKYLPSKYFYDRRGSDLFEQICGLPEYYQTETEISILMDNAEAIMEPFESGDIVEMGSGANWKICRLIDAANKPDGEDIRYVPVDVSESALLNAAEELLHKYRRLKVMGIVADFTTHIDVIPNGVPRLIVLFGSTIGNFSETESQKLLQNVADTMNREDRFLIGIDMIKSKDILEAAYNDPDGITSEFNKNILHVVNRELNANFKSDNFEHIAFFNEERKQIEMHLKAMKNMSVKIRDLNLSVKFDKGETIHTEISRKFSRDSAEKIFSEADLIAEKWFSDSNGYFSLVELVKR